MKGKTPKKGSNKRTASASGANPQGFQQGANSGSPNGPGQNPDRLINEREAAYLLGFTDRTLQKWRQDGVGPAYKKIGRNVRYRLSTIQAMVTGGQCNSTSQYRNQSSGTGPKNNGGGRP